MYVRKEEKNKTKIRNKNQKGHSNLIE